MRRKVPFLEEVAGVIRLINLKPCRVQFSADHAGMIIESIYIENEHGAHSSCINDSLGTCWINEVVVTKRSTE